MLPSAEEENAGKKSLRYLLTDLPQIDIAIVGEPTLWIWLLLKKDWLFLI